ncbi:hypothetical protein QQF64_021673 [Cirrhinus molitorella]|uniref:Uncharacterized protein n=1 Tax=Cirrhinus molitorella TaxID=172907 RepID=A0ABR3L7P5_9TELE
MCGISVHCTFKRRRGGCWWSGGLYEYQMSSVCAMRTCTHTCTLAHTTLASNRLVQTIPTEDTDLRRRERESERSGWVLQEK